MVKYNDERDTAVLFTCGTCNLNCHYCQIDKNPVLKDIDAALAESFKGDYYFNHIKKYMPHCGQLRRVETWGGEPFIHMDRIYPLMHQLIEYYPYFEDMFSSTNFSFEGWIDQFFGLMDCFGDYPYRKFKYTLQLSVDGPPEINDRSRGKGTTEKCLKNFRRLMDLLDEGRLPENVELAIVTKATMDLTSLYDLQTKEAIIDFYKFFENSYIGPVTMLNRQNIYMTPCIPNMAEPSPVTKADGEAFANLCKLCREIEQENMYRHYFNYYTNITPFDDDHEENALSYHYGGHTCGSGRQMACFLPDGMMSTCHEGFVQFVGKYKEYAAKRDISDSVITFDSFISEQKVPMCTNDEGYAEHERKMAMYHPQATARLVSTVTMIIALAMAGQIQPEYLDELNALKGAIFIQQHSAFCIKNNYNETGSYMLQPVGTFKLFLNGALQHIQREGGLPIDPLKQQE